MTIPRSDLHVYHHFDHDDAPRVHDVLAKILHRLGALEAQGATIMPSIQEVKDQADRVLAAITAESDKDDAIIGLVTANTAMIASLKQQLADAIAANDPAALQGVLDSMTAAETSSLANAKKVTDAINAGTTAA